MNKIDVALTETLTDLIRNRACCDASLIVRALQRAPVDWWPNLVDVFANDDCAEARGEGPYALIYEALKRRTKEVWL